MNAKLTRETYTGLLSEARRLALIAFPDFDSSRDQVVSLEFDTDAAGHQLVRVSIIRAATMSVREDTLEVTP